MNIVREWLSTEKISLKLQGTFIIQLLNKDEKNSEFCLQSHPAKTLKYDDPKDRLSLLMAYLMIGKETNKFTLAGNHEFSQTHLKFLTVVSEVASFVVNPVL